MAELDSNRKQDDLTWLENLQRNSWEPEIIITGLILAFLFIFPAKIYEFSAYLVQDLGTGFLLSTLVLFYLSVVISVFKIFFIVQLSLRFIWAGLLGLSYAFPKGVNQEKLFKVAQGYSYQHPDEMVLRMEKICSMTLAYPVSISILILIFTFYLGTLIAIKVLFNLPFMAIYAFFLISIMAYAILMATMKKNKFKNWYSNTMLSSVGATYQSNIGKWFTVWYGLIVILLSIPVILNDVKGFDLFFNEKNLSETDINWPISEYYFEDVHPEEKRYPRAYAQSQIMEGSSYRLGLPFYVDDNKSLASLREKFQDELDSISWGKIEAMPDLYQIYIDDEPYYPKNWLPLKSSISGQKSFETILYLDSLESGIHELRVEKVMVIPDFLTNKLKFRHLENWSNFKFLKP
ncbi:hypothetical protein SAMN04488519_103309 [Algoriphagus ornithinivorans]|uniref:Uncharacterized protein n=1 Tax=Algoriphagus ornithinivorans TaxID=226506 RepID=A0A1I5E6D0_9BACT|nr:hypothetical protein [Algoriphagus ornithinivorans]SFO06906.1 hypothetical protein SAMN04488519_103309 [Algoriphagus ornithinivorans]